MYKPQLDDTIAAIATPIGHGGIGMIRLSGKKSLAIADKIFLGKKNTKPSQFKSYTVHLGWIVNKPKTTDSRPQTPFGFAQGKQDVRQLAAEEIIDEVLLTVMRSPKSYTCEDVVEISCHGGIVSLKRILDLVLAHGARLAEPGEFTKRAFLNGRIDLAQAEAVLDIIQAKTDSFLKVGINQLKGELTLELESIREALMGVYTHIEAIVNFPEDEVNAASKHQLLEQINSQHGRVKNLLASSDQGKILKEGIKIVLCGKPNVGKSSLLNVLLRQPRAIVTAIAGTTRDTIEETASIQGIPFQLIDTAGILEPRNLVEKEAVKRSRLYMESADLILFMLDGSRALSAQDKDLIARVENKNILVVVNKYDLAGKMNLVQLKKLFAGKTIIKISALKKIAIKDLETAIVKHVWHGKITDTPKILISNARHLEALKNCVSVLERATELFKGNHPLELTSEEIKIAVNYLDNITGRNVDNDLIDKIFSEFCIGK